MKLRKANILIYAKQIPKYIKSHKSLKINFALKILHSKRVDKRGFQISLLRYKTLIIKVKYKAPFT